MSHFYQKNIISYDESQKRLNNHLSGLGVIKILHSSSDTKKLIFIIYSEKHDNSYYFSIGTSEWIWTDSDGKDIPVFSDKFIDSYDGLFTTTDELNEIIKNKLIIKKVELIEKPKVLKIYFENNSVLEAKEDIESEDQSYYQLSIFGSKLYQNYDLLIMGENCKEEIENGNEQGPYKIALFDLDYFRMEHRNFTTHAIKQARERKNPVSLIQARVLYQEFPV